VIEPGPASEKYLILIGLGGLRGLHCKDILCLDSVTKQPPSITGRNLLPDGSMSVKLCLSHAWTPRGRLPGRNGGREEGRQGVRRTQRGREEGRETYRDGGREGGRREGCGEGGGER